MTLEQKLAELEARLDRLLREARLERHENLWKYGEAEAHTNMALRERIDAELAAFKADIDALKRPRIVG